MPKRNAFYAQSGGVTAVINASAAAVIETARKHKAKIGKVYAGRNGIIGALTEDLIDTSKESARSIAALLHTPAGAFGSCRYKLKSLDESRAQYERLIEVFRAHDIGYFFYNGGNDSADTCLKVSQLSATLGYPVIADAASQLRFALQESIAHADLILRSETWSETLKPDAVGRHAGWITAAVGMAEDAETPLPLVLLFPEIKFDEAKFLSVVEKKTRDFGYCCIGVSEGLKSPDGKLMAEAGTKDAFGHAQLGGVGPLIANIVKEKLKLKYHWAVADYLQRAARHLASKTDLEQSYAVGKAAVEFALAGKNAVMPAIVRVADRPYRWKIDEAPLTEVANREKMLPRNFIAADGFGITAKARAYLAPLIKGEAPPPFKDGLPRYVRLKNVAVPKKLAARFRSSAQFQRKRRQPAN